MGLAAKIVGIVNVTEDSFSDGGRFLDPTAARDQARALAAAGAAIVELGPASSHPDAAVVAAAVQIERLESVLDAPGLAGKTLGVDATQTEVLRWALARGITWLNDVRGFPDPGLYPDLARGTARLVVMHSLAHEERARREDAGVRQVLDSIERFFETRLTALVRAGIAEERLIVDPGMGFFLGRDPRASLAVLQRLGALRRRFGRPVLVSVSRKSFLRALTGGALEEAGAATLAAELHAARQGVDYIRTHDVRALRDALTIEEALADATAPPRR